MPSSTSRSAKTSRRNPARGKSQPVTGGQLDHLAGVDTGYPDMHSQRRLPGNGPAPENPFGGRIPNPHES